jgi:acetyltransferase-like isoleucine patch superfamily enzyme
MIIMNFFFRLVFKIVWLIISFFSKAYWFFWRQDLFVRFIKVGANVHIGRYGHFICENISIGNNVYIGQECRFQAVKSKIIIGNHVMFGPNVSIHGGNHRTDIIGRYMIDIKLEEKLDENDQDVVIEDDVWIGAQSIILKGVTIGQGSIVGAGSVIYKNVPPYTIIVGSTPQKIKERWSQEQIKIHESNLKKYL